MMRGSLRGTYVLVLVGMTVTAAILLWTYQLRLQGHVHGLAPIFFFLFAHNDYSGAVCAILILLGAMFVSPFLSTSAILRWAGTHPIIIAEVSALLLSAGTLLVYHNHPLSMDEYAALFQSQAFAAGHLSGSFPPQLLDWLIPLGFQDYFLNVSRITGSVAETYWPGFALLLAPFTWAGISWACNPVVSALTLIVVHRLALALFNDREAAGLVLLLTIASPVIFANGISYYSMPAHLLANSLFALLLIQPTPRRAFAAGVVGALALSLHNPVPHMLFAAPWLIWIAARPDRVRLLAALGAGYLPLGVLLGVGWFEFSTQLLHGGLAISRTSAAASDRLEHMLSIFSLPSSTLLLVRLIGLAKLWIWAVPGLMILATAGAMRWWRHTTCRLFAISALLTLLGYFFVPVDQGHGWGYRYFHSAWMALPILATAAMFRPIEPRDSRRESPHGVSRIFEEAAVKSYVTACIVLTLIFGIGWRAWQIQEFVTNDLRQLPHYSGTERQIVIINGKHSFYGADLVQNDPWLRGNVIRMYSRGAAVDAKMMAEYCPNLRQVYADRYGTVWSEASALRGSLASHASNIALCISNVRAGSG
jgi:hypothetical protein